MTKLETNALRIIGLLYPDIDINGIEKYKDFFSSYNGLMPIVFECNNSPFCVIQTGCLYRRNYIQFVDVNDCTCNDPVYYETEPEFIEALQLAVIKYLELKND